MLKERLAMLIKYATILFMLLPSVALSQTQKIKEYKVIKGDTLWDISKKELNDSFLWPKVWKENPSIANPDKLYPGQTLRIPLYLIQEEKSEEQVAPEPAAATETVTEKEEPAQKEIPAAVIEHPLVSRDLILAGGYIADSIPPAVGKLGDSPSGRTLFGDNDTVYVTVDQPAQAGERFYIIKVSEPVKHPVTRKRVGYIVTVRGVVEITKIDRGETWAKITKSFGPIDMGDLLEPYYEIETPMTDGSFRAPDIDGTVLASNRETIFQGMLDIVYIDRGCEDGIEVGDMFRTLAVDAHAVPNGAIRVISCRDHTATAIIEKSSAPVSPGNIFDQFISN